MSPTDLKRIFPEASESFLKANAHLLAPPAKTEPARLKPTQALQVMASAMSEDEWMALVVGMAESWGWRWRHITRTTIARKDGTQTGDHDARDLPDLFLWRPPRFMVRELKTETGILSPGQSVLLQDWAECQVDVGVWRPRDMERITAELTGSDA